MNTIRKRIMENRDCRFDTREVRENGIDILLQHCKDQAVV
jgi:hypothetical protein